MATVVIALTLAAPLRAAAHPERRTSFPNPAYGAVPGAADTGTRLISCAPDSRQRIVSATRRRVRARDLRLLRRCRFHSLQAAIDAAPDNATIVILPGTYHGPPKPQMSQLTELQTCGPPEPNTHGDARQPPPQKYLVASHQYQLNCPAMRNDFWIMGNSTLHGRRRSDGSWSSDCTRHCFLHLDGAGDDPGDVVLAGDRARQDVLHVDRADGTSLRNFTVQDGAFNGINVIETNGYAIRRIVARRNQNYGVLTFTTDHGLYDHVTAYDNGHAGLYPGSTADGMSSQGDCVRFPVEIRNSDSYHNTYGYSGTAANSVWVHDSAFHDNATGLSTDSLSSAHPGMPEDCARWDHNRIYSNNFNPFTVQGTASCQTPYDARNDTLVCPYFAAPVGTGVQIGGGNANLVADNWIYDNHRTGVRLFWLPGPVRYPDPTADDHLAPGLPGLVDTSFANHFVGNRFGTSPTGARAPNGADFWWDGEGAGNCVGEYTEHAGSFTGVRLPSCAGVLPAGANLRVTSIEPYVATRHPDALAQLSLGNPAEDADQIGCILFDPRILQRPPGCPWIDDPS